MTNLEAESAIENDRARRNKLPWVFLSVGFIVFISKIPYHSTIKTVNSLSPWEHPDCINLYYPIPHQDALPITKYCWDSSPIMRIDKKKLSETVDPWPSSDKNRQPKDNFFSALKDKRGAKPKPNLDCLTYDFASQLWKDDLGDSNTKKMFQEPLDTTLAYRGSVILDETHRAIYIVDLKSGSTSLTKIITAKSDNTLRSCFELKNQKKNMLNRIMKQECDGKCLLTCDGKSDTPTHHNWSKQALLRSSDIPDEIASNYLVFSFVRDPFTRSESSYHETLVSTTAYAQHLRGEGRGSNNVHYRSQAYQLLARPTRSGRPMPLHFVGKLEDFENDLARLRFAMTATAISLSPDKRKALIPPKPSIRGERKNATGTFQRKGPPHDPSHQPAPKSKTGLMPSFTVEQELEVCRRYLQDLICFDYGIPSSCIDHATEVF